jgi:Undecaprenyl-phosphate glucose phosphotransferase
MKPQPQLRVIQADSGLAEPQIAGLQPSPSWLPSKSYSNCVFAGDARAAFVGALRLLDILAMILAAIFCFWLRHGSLNLPKEYWWYLVIGCFIVANSLEIAQLYTITSIRRLSRCLSRMAVVWTAAMLALIAMIYFTKVADDFSRAWVLLWGGSGFLAIVMVHWLAQVCMGRWRRSGTLVSNVAVVGDGQGAERLARRIARENEGEIHFVGLFQATSRHEDDQARDLDDLMQLARNARIDEIAIALPCAAELGAALRKLGTIPADVKLCPDLSELNRFGIASAGIPAALLLERPLAGWRTVVKRSLDVMIGATLLVLLAPVMLIIAILIKCDSPGPVLFRQLRFGFNKNPITVYKFRSMYFETVTDPAVPQARRDDPRVTRLGRFLRRSSLDELPQLFNVLAGSMSLVGPRPHAVAHDEKYAGLVDQYLARLRVKPGITGWAQVNGLRGETDTIEKMERRVEHDLYYIDHWSPFLDVQILFRTLIVGFNHRSAY